jgi:hypothetical protein
MISRRSLSSRLATVLQGISLALHNSLRAEIMRNRDENLHVIQLKSNTWFFRVSECSCDFVAVLMLNKSMLLMEAFVNWEFELDLPRSSHVRRPLRGRNQIRAVLPRVGWARAS